MSETNSNVPEVVLSSEQQNMITQARTLLALPIATHTEYYHGPRPATRQERIRRALGLLLRGDMGYPLGVAHEHHNPFREQLQFHKQVTELGAYQNNSVRLKHVLQENRDTGAMEEQLILCQIRYMGEGNIAYPVNVWEQDLLQPVEDPILMATVQIELDAMVERFRT